MNSIQANCISIIEEIAGGGFHSIALKNNGEVLAWGDNTYGQLGNGTTTNSTVPIQVSGGLTDVIAISGGYYHSLALKSDGTVWAWGYNALGQLGNGTTDNSSMPIQVGGGLTNVIAIAAGGYHSLALTADGTVWAWGYNVYGQLGDGTFNNSTLPVQVQGGLTNIVEIAAGFYHSLALNNNGSAFAWGNNANGQLGNGTLTNSNLPIAVIGQTEAIKAIAGGGEHSLALLSDGTVWAWGYNAFGQLGNGTNNNSNIPIQVENLTNIIAISAGLDHSLALKKNERVWAWGDNTYGQLGIGNNNNSNVPQKVGGGLITVTSIAGGGDHSLALRKGGYIWAWGDNSSGQLGNGTFINSNIPIETIGLFGIVGVISLASGGDHSLALKNNGTVWAWGDNSFGQLGNGSTDNSLTPIKVNSLTNIISIAGGLLQSFALQGDGTIWSWGNNDLGQLGNGTTVDSHVPVQVVGLSEAKGIAGGFYHTLAVKGDGTVWAWGDNETGQLGNGTFISSSIPVQVVGLNNAVAVAAGGDHSLALKSDGTVWAWGDNSFGQLGDGTTTTSNVPVQVGSGLTNFIAIACGQDHSLALRSDGTAYGWGDNEDGQLGNGTNTNSSVPTQVRLSNVKAIAAGANQSLAVNGDGEVFAWGDNSFGQLGIGSTVSSNVPLRSGNLNDVIAVAGGRGHSLALKSNGTAWGWGNNFSGQVGDGNTTNALLPMQTSNLLLTRGLKVVSAGFYHSLALNGDGFVWTWGDNAQGQLGDGTTTNSTIPLLIEELDNVIAIAGGGYHSLALKADGTVWAWGDNAYGQLGNGSTVNSNVPVQVHGLNNIIAIAGGGFHSLALKIDGSVWAWGKNETGQLGNGTNANSSVPVQVSNLTTVKAIAAGKSHSLALKSAGVVWAWGHNKSGQLGNGTTNNSNVPVLVVGGLNEVSTIAAGGRHSLVLRGNGTIETWGNNGSGQLGNGTTVNSSTPVQVNNFIANIIAGGGLHSLAKNINGTAWAWGNNEVGQLGNRTITNSAVPVQVKGRLKEVNSLAGGKFHSLALKCNGAVWAWGDNTKGQLGNGTTTNSNVPIKTNFTIGIIATPEHQKICSGTATSIALSSNIPGLTFRWSVVQNGVTGASSGTGDFIAQTLKTTGQGQGLVTYIITSTTADGCAGPSTNVRVRVKDC
jgi:alpha-tubulin suppressor-like RCC1 family protein